MEVSLVYREKCGLEGADHIAVVTICVCFLSLKDGERNVCAGTLYDFSLIKPQEKRERETHTHTQTHAQICMDTMLTIMVTSLKYANHLIFIIVVGVVVSTLT